MGLNDKIKKAKKSDWLTKGIDNGELKSLIELAQISAKLERRRIEMGMTQKDFADYLGVSQGMVSKWESREYNFTIKSLNDICERIGLEFRPVIDYVYKTPKYKLLPVESIDQADNVSIEKWLNRINLKENGEIA